MNSKWVSLCLKIKRSISTIIQSKSPATLQKVSEQALVNSAWSQSPFLIDPHIIVPVYNISDGSFSNQNVVLSPQIFNNPIRKDIIHNAFIFEKLKNYKTYKRTKTAGDVAGSGKKPRPQKKTGRARQGKKRAPLNYHGGHPFGKVPRDFYFPLNKKIRMAALLSLLSAKLYENKIIIFENEELSEGKIKILKSSFKPFENYKILFLIGDQIDESFSFASRNLENMRCLLYSNLSVKPLLKCDYLFLTLSSLDSLEQHLKERIKLLYRNKKIPISIEDARQKYMSREMKIKKEITDNTQQIANIKNPKLFTQLGKEFAKDYIEYLEDPTKFTKEIKQKLQERKKNKTPSTNVES